MGKGSWSYNKRRVHGFSLAEFDELLSGKESEPFFFLPGSVIIVGHDCPQFGSLDSTTEVSVY